MPEPAGAYRHRAADAGEPTPVVWAVHTGSWDALPAEVAELVAPPVTVHRWAVRAG